MKTAIILAVTVGIVLAQQNHHHNHGRHFNPGPGPQQQQQQHQQSHRHHQQQIPQSHHNRQGSNNQYNDNNDNYQEPARPQPQPQIHHQPPPPQQQRFEDHRHDDRGSPSPGFDRRTTPIPIIQWNKQQEHDGTYRTNYETGNNIVAEESGYIKTVGQGEDQAEALVQQGSYSYTSPEGQLISVQYTADETGFHATGDHIPTPPPVSEEIQKGLDLIYAGIRQQQEEAAREAQYKSQQPLSQQISRQEDERRYRP